MGAAESHLNLEPGTAHASLVGQPSVGMAGVARVEPGQPEGSYLLRKLRGEAIVGERMPLAKPPLPDSLIRVIEEWIRRGAPGD